MPRSRIWLTLIVGLALGTSASTASARPTFHSRIGAALGLIPPVNGHGRSPSPDVATDTQALVTYHGGAVMTGGVTVHTIFWAPAGFSFQGSPAPGIPTYQGLIERYFSDVAHDSGSFTNVFSVLAQFAEGTRVGRVTPGDYSISYDPASDAVSDTSPYPASANQCASPNNASGACVTDSQVQAEVDRIVQSTPGTPRGLHNLWYVFLPPNVDECIMAEACGTNAFAGYHSAFDLREHGVTIYAVTTDPLIEAAVAPGEDPQGYPDAEATADAAAHETVEAITDPEGAGYLDPNGFEVGDKCEQGPQRGTPLGFANGSPYNQIVNGHLYLTQEMWSNDDHGCVQRTTLSASPLPLAQVNLSQFSSTVTGNIGANRAGIGVRVTLVRAGVGGQPVAVARSPMNQTTADGNWSASVAPHAVGDDRDRIDVDYSGAGAPSPRHQVILTGDGGDPFTQSGWTGWAALDDGSFATNERRLRGPSVTLAPCSQTGVLQLTVNNASTESPLDVCNTQTDAATVATPMIAPGTIVTAASNDNRAFSPPDGPAPNPLGGLVSLHVPVGEPDAVSLMDSPLAPFAPSGFPSCRADLEVQRVSCTGLVAARRYWLITARAHATRVADGEGRISAELALHGGSTVRLKNRSRTLTTLHVAHLQVKIVGEQTVLARGRCQPGEYYGSPLRTIPISDGAGERAGGGTALTGEICPLSGDATGLSSKHIAQTDEFSDGQTQTEVPEVKDTSPIEGETVYGGFRAIAESGLPGPNNKVLPTDSSSHIAVSIARIAGGAPVFTRRNVDTGEGVAVPALAPGSYRVTWTLSDANGDTRTITTRFVEQPAAQGPNGRTADRRMRQS